MAQNAKRSSEDRTSRTISVVSAFLAAVAITWSFYTYFHPQAPTPAVAFSSYASSTHLFRIRFPSGWAVSETLQSSPTPTPTGSAPSTAQGKTATSTPTPVVSHCQELGTPVTGTPGTGTPIIGNVTCAVSASVSVVVASPEFVDEGVLFVSPDLQSELAVWTGQFEPTYTDLPFILTQFISTVNGRDPGPVAFDTRTVNGATWTTLSALFTRVNTEESGTLLYMRHGGTSYYVLWAAPSTRETSDKATYFDPMLSSLTFLIA